MILTEEKAAFAAEHHGVITQYLKERGLSPDEYYDTVVFAFLDCVISGKDNFKKRAYAAMDRAVAAVKAESEGNVISLFCNDDYYRIVAETLADERDGITELLERIHNGIRDTECGVSQRTVKVEEEKRTIYHFHRFFLSRISLISTAHTMPASACMRLLAIPTAAPRPLPRIVASKQK